MSSYPFSHDNSGLAARLRSCSGPVIICYCAAWCDTCGAYRAGFDALAAQRPQETFVWTDIEDHPEVLGELDVENFPTVAVQARDGNLFFGPLPPHPAHLERMLEHLDPNAPPLPSGPPLLVTLV